MTRLRLSILLMSLWLTIPVLAADPTRPPSAAEIRAWRGESSSEAADVEWRLQSILSADDRRLAIINGQRVRRGDRIDDALVVAIETDHVVLEHRGRPISLRLGHRHSLTGTRH